VWEEVHGALELDRWLGGGVPPTRIGRRGRRCSASISHIIIVRRSNFKTWFLHCTKSWRRSVRSSHLDPLIGAW